jgi:N-acetylmuramoyl-L-alanine amidase
MDTESRLAKLEKEMATMRGDVGMMMPALTKLAEAQGDIKQILADLESGYGASGIDTMKSQPPTAQNISYNDGTAVSQVRVGEHPGKTRVVLDVSGDVAFNYDVDNAEGLLTVTLPGTAWNGQDGMQIINSPVIASYTAAPDGQGGTQMMFQLKKQAQVIWAKQLPAAAGSVPRIVMDVAPL